ncbi:MAG: hypothetical protein IT305_17310 [Chloroflexi bacterium]|nr:hypothetical protein [Chloroflexota bacterium]
MPAIFRDLRPYHAAERYCGDRPSHQPHVNEWRWLLLLHAGDVGWQSARVN